MMQASPDQTRQRWPLWPLLYCVTPVLLALGLLLLVKQPQRAANQPAANSTPKSSAVPELGSGATDVPAPARPPEDDQAQPATPTSEPVASTPQPEAQAGEREIDIHIRNLKFAVQQNNGKGRQLETEWLQKALPRERVLARLALASDSEPDSQVRLAWFACLTDVEAELTWARRHYARWAGRFLGTDPQLEAGNQVEFSAYARVLFSAVPLAGEGLELARNVLTTGKPEWVLAVLAECLAFGKDAARRVEPLWPELSRLLESGSGAEARDLLFVAWSRHFDTMDGLLAALSDSRMLGCVLALLKSGAVAKGFYGPEDSARLLRFAGGLLTRKEAESLQADLIRALAGTLPTAQQEIWPIIEAGLTRRDGNLAEYLAAFGKLATKPEELKRLAEFANEADPDVARGAVNGLRNSAAPGADDELRIILAIGTNTGIKGDALAALLARNPDSKGRLVDEYLGEDRPAALRAIAVAYLSDKQLDRLKELGESDPELRVREAAINRLGALKDKSLKTWFTRVSRSDSSASLRQLARKYAAELD